MATLFAEPNGAFCRDSQLTICIYESQLQLSWCPDDFTQGNKLKVCVLCWPQRYKGECMLMLAMQPMLQQMQYQRMQLQCQHKEGYPMRSYEQQTIMAIFMKAVMTVIMTSPVSFLGGLRASL